MRKPNGIFIAAVLSQRPSDQGARYFTGCSTHIDAIEGVLADDDVERGIRPLLKVVGFQETKKIEQTDLIDSKATNAPIVYG